MDKKIIDSFDLYFNNILKKSLNYDEVFDIFIRGRNITLLADQKSQLINMMNKDPDLFSKIEQQIYLGFKQYNPDIIVEIIIVNDYAFYVIYGFDITSIKEIGVYANIAKDLTLKQLSNFCLLNSTFDKICQDELFWIKMIEERFGELPKVRINNYRKLYTDILEYIEFLEEKEEISYEDYIGTVSTLLNNLNANSILFLIKLKIFNLYVTPINNSKHINSINIIKALLLNYKLTKDEYKSLIQSVIERSYRKSTNHKNLPAVLELLLDYKKITLSSLEIENIIENILRNFLINKQEEIVANPEIKSIVERYI